MELPQLLFLVIDLRIQRGRIAHGVLNSFGAWGGKRITAEWTSKNQSSRAAAERSLPPIGDARWLVIQDILPRRSRACVRSSNRRVEHTDGIQIVAGTTDKRSDLLS